MSNLNKRATLQSERSFDSSTGRPTKYFKLDRTYSDVIEDELYDPQAENHETASTVFRKSPQFRTERIQTAYPQLFDTSNNTSSGEAQAKADHYWPGMESGIRFEKDSREELRGHSPVIADKKQKLKQQPEQSTVSPKEAFLDYSDTSSIANNNSVFELSNARQMQRHTQKPNTTIACRTPQFPTMSSQPGFGEISIPKTITPVRAHEKLSPRPVSRGQRIKDDHVILSSGPTKAQADDNAAANAKIRALYKEESTTSNVSATSEVHSPPSAAESDAEYHPAATYLPLSRSTQTNYECEECLESFDRASHLELHARIHARPPASVGPQTLHEDDYSEEEEVDIDHHDTSAHEKNKNRTSGPHRCDWVIPSTGQVCGTVFSRPYDLVRHQDTIHRAKKLEFRCEICIAAGTNKIFSRNDALVRHMRHVHKRDLPKRA